MSYTVAEIAEALGAKLLGASDISITGASEPATAGPDDIALALKPEYAETLGQGAARVAVLWDGADWQALGLEAAIVVPRPRYALSGLSQILDPGPEIAIGIHPTAVIDPSASIGEGAAIGPFVVIGRDVSVGANARIASHVSIGAETRIGPDALILEGARIGARVVIGARFIAQPSCVIGSDGFSFVTPEKSTAEAARETLGKAAASTPQTWARIHSLGTVEIGDDVEVGACTAIDRGTVRATRIGRGTKIDNLVQVGHNVEVGEDVLLCGQTGIAGSARIGNRVVLGGQTGVSDNIFIGDDVVAGGGTGIMTNVPAGRVVLGYPALKMETQIEASKNIRRLPRLFRDVKALQKAVSKTGGSD